MHKTIFGTILANLTFLALLSTGAFAQSNDSVYTKINLDEGCSLIEAHEMAQHSAAPDIRDTRSWSQKAICACSLAMA